MYETPKFMNRGDARQLGDKVLGEAVNAGHTHVHSLSLSNKGQPSSLNRQVLMLQPVGPLFRLAPLPRHSTTCAVLALCFHYPHDHPLHTLSSICPRMSLAANGSVLSSSSRKLWLVLLLCSTMACFMRPSTYRRTSQRQGRRRQWQGVSASVDATPSETSLDGPSSLLVNAWRQEPNHELMALYTFELR